MKKNNLENQLRKRVVAALAEFAMIEENDRVMVALSGVKIVPYFFICSVKSKNEAPIALSSSPSWSIKNSQVFQSQTLPFGCLS